MRKAEHLTTDDCRQIFGDKAADRTDRELEEVRQWCAGMARILVRLATKEQRPERAAREAVA